MNKQKKLPVIMYLGSKPKEERRRRVGVEYEDWAPMDHWGPYMPTTHDLPAAPMSYYDERIHSAMSEPESAFYDRRGRRHYDSGRYAPMSAYGEPESRRRYPRYSDGRFAPRSAYGDVYNDWDGDRPESRMERDRPPRSYGGEEPRMIGFGRDWEERDMRSDATVPQYREMDRMHGQPSQRGGAYSERLPQFDQRMAMEWTQSMVNADGTKGPHWPMEKTREIAKQYGIDCDPVEFFAVINSIYSDYCEALKKNNASTLETYAMLAKAWIDDDDAVKNKAAAYFSHIVK